MSKNKNHNSILFLTTLGLYFGLVLAGASPQLLAQAATTRNFDIKDEIEFKDDLDTKPDSDEDAAHWVDNYFGKFGELLEELGALHHDGKFDPGHDEFRLLYTTFVPCDYKGVPTRRIVKDISGIKNKTLVPELTVAAIRFEDYSGLSDCFESNKFGEYTVQSSDLTLEYDASSLTVKVSINKKSPELARQAAANFNRAFETLKIKSDSVPVKIFSEDTSFSFDNNQVFIVTRLPRGSIDKLFAPAPAAAK